MTNLTTEQFKNREYVKQINNKLPLKMVNKWTLTSKQVKTGGYCKTIWNNIPIKTVNNRVLTTEQVRITCKTGK